MDQRLRFLEDVRLDRLSMTEPCAHYQISRKTGYKWIARAAAEGRRGLADRTVSAAIRTLTGERDLAVGIVACLQTHGSRANWHPHLHLLVTDGGFRPDGTFVTWPAHDTVRLTEAFRRTALRRSSASSSSTRTRPPACSPGRTPGSTSTPPSGSPRTIAPSSG